MKRKTFDAIDMKRRGAESIHEQVKALTEEEQLALWAERTEALRERQRASQEKQEVRA
jgi:hypothetical protein